MSQAWTLALADRLLSAAVRATAPAGPERWWASLPHVQALGMEDHPMLRIARARRLSRQVLDSYLRHPILFPPTSRR